MREEIWNYDFSETIAIKLAVCFQIEIKHENNALKSRGDKTVQGESRKTVQRKKQERDYFW